MTRPRAEGMFWNYFTRRLDGYISLNRACSELIPRRFPAMESLPHAVIPHGHYRGAYPAGTSRLEARRRLGISLGKNVFLFLGTIAPYKGVPALLDAFHGVRYPEAVLLVAGAVAHKKTGARLRVESCRDPRVRLHLSRIRADELELYFMASDLVVLPFSDILNSGSALLALSFNRPLLVPALGALPELRELVGAEWISTYSGTLTAQHLERSIDWALHAKRPQRTPLELLDWNMIASDTLRFYSAVLTRQESDFSMALAPRDGAEGIDMKAEE